MALSMDVDEGEMSDISEGFPMMSSKCCYYKVPSPSHRLMSVPVDDYTQEEMNEKGRQYFRAKAQKAAAKAAKQQQEAWEMSHQTSSEPIEASGTDSGEDLGIPTLQSSVTSLEAPSCELSESSLDPALRNHHEEECARNDLMVLESPAIATAPAAFAPVASQSAASKAVPSGGYASLKAAGKRKRAQPDVDDGGTATASAQSDRKKKDTKKRPKIEYSMT